MIFATPSSVQLMLFDEPQVAKRGRFTVKNTPDALQTIRGQVSEELKQNRDRKSVERLVAILERLTVVQLHDLKRQHGMKASGRTKAELVQKLASRLDQGRRADFSASPVVELTEKQIERLLVMDLQNGVEDAFDRLYETYHRQVKMHLTSKGAKCMDMQDCTQETFLRVSQSIHTLDPDKSLLSFLKTIAYRVWVDLHRKESRRGKSRISTIEDVDDIRVDHDEISESLDNGTEFAFAMTILDEQPELTKQIVRMYFFDQMTYLEIAQRLNIGVTTAKDRVKKAIGAVQQRAVVSCCK